MEIDKLLRTHKNCKDKDMLGMILSNKLDIMYKGKACISSDKWAELSDDLIKWKNTYYPTTENMGLRLSAFTQTLLRKASHILKRCRK